MDEIIVSLNKTQKKLDSLHLRGILEGTDLQVRYSES